MASSFIIRKLIIDDHNELFDARGMKYKEYASDLSKVRSHAVAVLKGCPKEFLEGNLLEQQLSELIKNAIKHGNGCDIKKKVKIWYDLRKHARFIIEDEGEGFQALEKWNKFFKRRQTALFKQDFDTFLRLASFRGPDSDDSDGGNGLIAALEYWNGGVIFNGKRNKIGVVRWFGSE